MKVYVGVFFVFLGLTAAVGMVGFSVYGIYQFFQGQWLSSIAALLIAILSEKWVVQASPYVKAVADFVKNLENSEELEEQE